MVHLQFESTHHKRLVSLINKIYDDFTNGVGHMELGAVILDLANYATYHFAAEEQWMILQGYPDLELHRAEHLKFSNRIVEIRNEYNSGKTDLSPELFRYLVEWLTNHIQKSDGDYGRFAKSLKNDIAQSVHD